MTKEQGNGSKKGSLSLIGAVSMGTGVMIGAGIFALTGQIADLAGSWFPLAFILAAVVASFSAYSYIKLANAYPSAGGIAMFLKKAYGRSLMTGALALLMYFSMIINESLVARTFGTYTLQLFDAKDMPWLVPALGVALLVFAFCINVLSNKFIQSVSFIAAFIKIAGLAVLAVGGLWASGLSFESISAVPEQTTAGSFLGAVALGILGYKGFTTITNSGGEISNPHKNVGRAIIIAIAICTLLYVLVSLAVGANLTIAEIVHAKDYSLAEASRPAFGQYGLWFTVGFAIIATVSGVIASVFAVSRMLAMLTKMQLVPHRHFKLPGDIQIHTLIYTIVIAILLTIFFDLSRIASLGAIFYIIMDIGIHWGVFRHLRRDVAANATVLIIAMVLDVIVLVAFLWVKVQSDMLVIWASLIGLTAVFVGEKYFLKLHHKDDDDPHYT
ncbi:MULTISPECIES: APC family permease [unclassified Arsukibacterium]|uniref:APC family permease n=1 Tax=unclassified Arsukibacterium TaxID=2635278 RepID=UPI000C4CD877|nr:MULTISPECIES: APC family permease [unclassified Arsukibacterium]MAA96080.1 amino acid permease [Rheinheimera sp.]MBM32916.1 amino acid permease [Rheinheimera sp.]HAW91604.1 amino acid permease [Candidatus Azambacteria bacterium]|tara:strand:- start:1064 stop:2392 length:1329 start_codon:yes stop_codon:yes gene_type:complete